MSARIEITILTGVSAGDVFRFDLQDPSGAGSSTNGSGEKDAKNSFTIGRSPECELVLQQSTVSRRHATIERRGDGFYIVDLGSAHGTQHMGFPLHAGAEGGRKLSSGDEFKISDLLFKVRIPQEAEPAKATPEQKKDTATAAPLSAADKRRKMIRLAIPVLLLLLTGVWFLSSPKKGGLPQQKSNEVLFPPAYVVLGYFPGKSSDKKELKDSSHLDLVQFDLPSSDLLVEFDVFSESPIEVKLDGSSVETIAPTGEGWSARSLLVRDIALGTPRRLVFDNTDFPKKAGDKSRIKRWAVKNVRAVTIPPMTGLTAGFNGALQACLGLAEALDKSPDGLFLFVRGLQAAAIQLMHEQRIDVIGYSVLSESSSTEGLPELSEIQVRLKELLLQSSRSSGPEAARSLLELLAKHIGQFDAEIWRRVNNRLSKARTAVKVQHSIEAHDQIMSVLSMFPPDGDLRWTQANRMYTDNKIVPKNVRERPDKFRPAQ